MVGEELWERTVREIAAATGAHRTNPKAAPSDPSMN